MKIIFQFFPLHIYNDGTLLLFPPVEHFFERRIFNQFRVVSKTYFTAVLIRYPKFRFAFFVFYDTDVQPVWLNTKVNELLKKNSSSLNQFIGFLHCKSAATNSFQRRFNLRFSGLCFCFLQIEEAYISL